MKLFLKFVLILNFILFTKINAEETKLLRFPTINDNQIVFTYAGDLYTVSLDGGVARKLTNHIGYEMFAKFSPDGKTVAFTGQYDGNTEVFTIPAQGGEPQRLTYTATLGRDDISDRMGPNNIVMAWSPDGKEIIYRSRKETFNDFVGALFKVSVDGGMSQEIPLSGGGFSSFSPDGKKLAFNRVFREFRTWKYYQGGMADDIWIFDFETKEIENITTNKAQDVFPMWIDDEIFFASDRDRIMNLFSYNTKTKETKKVTNFDNYDIKFPSHNGSSIVFENGGEIYHFNAKNGDLNKISITIYDDYEYARKEFKNVGKNIVSADLSPNGERVITTARGDIFSLPAENGITYNFTNSSNAHDREAVWSPNGKYIAYISDKSGEYEIYLQDYEGKTAPIQITDGTNSYIFTIKWSPDSEKILYHDRQGRLQYVDINSKKSTLVFKSEYGRMYGGYNWSPDSKWIAYTDMTRSRIGVVKVYNLADKSTNQVTDDWYSSSQPQFSNDGKYLLFESDRSFNPIYSYTEWNHAYQNMSNIYIAILDKNEKSPFAPKNDVVNIEKQEDSKNKSKEKKNDADENKKSVNVKIDFDNISSRIVALPTASGNYSNIYCINNKVYYNYLVSEASGNSNHLKMYDLSKQEETTLGEKMSMSPSANGKKALIYKDKKLSVIDLPTASIKLEKFVNTENMNVWIDYSQEWKQIYDESWRQMRDFFYVENMHGVDWEAMHKKYDALLPYVKHRNDLTYLIGELIGELNIGHAYVNSGEKPEPKRIKTGLLGAKICKDKSGYFKIEKIIEGKNWDNDVTSPLQAVGVDAKVGEFIISVNGKDLKNTNDIYSTLVGLADKTVELELNSNPSSSGSRKVLVTPIADESSLYYYDWVQNNIIKVNEATNGEVGYIHVPDMGPEGLNEFVKHFYPQLSKKALIIDDRGNGGGNVSPMLLERLSRVVYRQNVVRGSIHASTIPAQTHYGPKVLLMDRYSASDGDLFPYGFQKLGLGKTIGTRSWGGVVGITSSLPFVDGGDLRKPEFASFSSEESEWIIEGYGVDPDIVIDNDPHREYLGIDDQLNKAIEVILEELKEYKELPEIPVAPDKSR